MIKFCFVRENVRKFVIQHCHNEMEINVFLSGKATYLVNGIRYPVRTGDVFVFQPCMFHCLYHENEDAEISLIKIIFDDKELLSIFGNSDNSYKKVKISGISACSKSIVKACRLLCEEEEGQHDSEESRILLAYIAQKIKKSYSDDVTENTRKVSDSKYPHMADIIDYADKNFEKDITVNDLAKLSHLSINRFTDAFKKYTGVTPKKYISMKRIALACTKLVKGEQSVTQIAFEVGYNSTASFNKSFLNIVGVTPTAFINSVREELGKEE